MEREIIDQVVYTRFIIGLHVLGAAKKGSVNSMA
jgi:hypothetical protein